METTAVKKRMCEILTKCLYLSNKEIIKILINGGADINANKPVIVKNFVTHGDIELIKLLVEKNITLHDFLIDDMDLLEFSIKRYQNDIAKYLLNISVEGAYLFDVSNSKAFLIAVESGDISLVQIFLDRGVDINHINSQSQNALHFALSKGRYDVAKLLFSNKNFQINSDNGTVLRNRIINNDVEAVSLLLDNGIDVNVKDSNEVSPLYLALNCKNYDIAKMIVSKRPINHYLACDVNANNGKALIDAVTRNDVEFVSLLLKNGADTQAKNMAALEISAMKGYVEITQLLIDYLWNPVLGSCRTTD